MQRLDSYAGILLRHKLPQSQSVLSTLQLHAGIRITLLSDIKHQLQNFVFQFMGAGKFSKVGSLSSNGINIIKRIRTWTIDKEIFVGILSAATLKIPQTTLTSLTIFRAVKTGNHFLIRYSLSIPFLICAIFLQLTTNRYRRIVMWNGAISILGKYNCRQNFKRESDNRTVYVMFIFKSNPLISVCVIQAL